MRIALHSEIADGAIEQYRTEHATIPADLVAVFAEAGISDWSIYRSGRRLFHLVECEDFDRAMDVVRASEADARWQANIGRFVADFYDTDGNVAFAPLESVWTLAEQRDA